MKSPSTGNFEPGSKTDRDATGDDHADAPDKTRASVKGEASPRLPHERDESMQTGSEPPNDFMRTAKQDADSPKVPTDKSRETDAAYEKLRGRTPGSERDR